MRAIKGLKVFLFLISLGLVSSFAMAKNPNEVKCPDEKQAKKSDQDPHKQLTNAFEMGALLQEYLDENVEMVAFVSRKGSDLSKEKFKEYRGKTKRYRKVRHKYSHAGIVFKNVEADQWQFRHQLNTCGGKRSHIYDQGLAQFFLDDPHMYDFKVVIPKLDLQKRILEVLLNESVGKKGWAHEMHISKYSNIAHPFKTKYQNSNGWLLAIVAAAQSNATRIKDAQEFYKWNGYKPSLAKVSTLRQFGKGLDWIFGNKRRPNAHIDDHSQEEQRSRWFKWVSDLSIYNYLGRNGELISAKTICHPKGCNLKAHKMNRKD